MDLIAMFHELRRGSRTTGALSRGGHLEGREQAVPPDIIDEKTWQDLAMDEVFAKLDRTVSMPGRQVLYDQMRTCEADDRVLLERARQHACFHGDARLREEIQLLLARLGDPRAAWISPLLLKDLPEVPTWAPLLYPCSFLSLACLAGAFFWKPFILPSLGLMLLNLVVNETYGRRITPYFSGFSQLDALLGSILGLAGMGEGRGLPQVDLMREAVPLVVRLRRRFGWLARDRATLPEPMPALIGYLNLLFLFDVVIFLRSVASLRKHRLVLVDLLEAVGSLDAAISVASYQTGLSHWTVPEITPERRIQAEGLYHPLLAAPVANPLHLTQRSALITGSNMAGKTTFIRTVGINVILARTLNFCLAERATLPKAMVKSSIRREDKLAEGQSYYFTELKRLREFLDAGPLHLFLIDEIFRGTNTVERIAASSAVLRQLARDHMVLVTTHDLELHEWLAEDFDMHHFSEQVVEGRCGFDYRIQPGPARSRNAIRLLELNGYPASITGEARELAEKIAAGFEGGGLPCVLKS